MYFKTYSYYGTEIKICIFFASEDYLYYISLHAEFMYIEITQSNLGDLNNKKANQNPLFSISMYYQIHVYFYLSHSSLKGFRKKEK